MNGVQFKIFPPPRALRAYVECFRAASSDSHENMAVRVCPNGHPGIAFHHHGGGSAIERIITPSGRDESLSALFLYGQVTTLSEMHFVPPYTALQIVLKPQALWSLFGLDASSLTNKSLNAEAFGAAPLSARLIAATSDEERIELCSEFLALKCAAAHDNVTIDALLTFIETHIDTANVEALCKRGGSSERQLERQFKQAVGMPPQLYIRIRRINAALKLLDSGRYARLADVAHALNFYDQSHFIRDIREFSGLTPKSILQKVDDFYHDQVGSVYLLY